MVRLLALILGLFFWISSAWANPPWARFFSHSYCKMNGVKIVLGNVVINGSPFWGEWTFNPNNLCFCLTQYGIENPKPIRPADEYDSCKMDCKSECEMECEGNCETECETECERECESQEIEPENEIASFEIAKFIDAMWGAEKELLDPSDPLLNGLNTEACQEIWFYDLENNENSQKAYGIYCKTDTSLQILRLKYKNGTILNFNYEGVPLYLKSGTTHFTPIQIEKILPNGERYSFKAHVIYAVSLEDGKWIAIKTFVGPKIGIIYRLVFDAQTGELLSRKIGQIIFQETL